MVLRTPSSHSPATLFWKHFLKVQTGDSDTEGKKELNLLILSIFYIGSKLGQLFHVCTHITPLTHRAHFSLQPWSFLHALQCVQYVSNMGPFRCLEGWFSLFGRVAGVGRACLILSYFFSSSLQPISFLQDSDSVVHRIYPPASCLLIYAWHDLFILIQVVPKIYRKISTSRFLNVVWDPRAAETQRTVSGPQLHGPGQLTFLLWASRVPSVKWGGGQSDL